MRRVTDEQRGVEWRERLERYRGAGLSVGRFCQREGVSVASFYRWRKTLAATPPEALEKVSLPAAFAAVRLVGSTNVAVQLPGGTRLEIPMADLRALESALQAVVKADAERGGGASC